MEKKKSLLKNSIFNAVYKGFTALFPLLTTTYISRVLLAGGVGKVAYANTIVQYFATVASLGIPNYGVKAIAQSNTSTENRSRTFYELFIINLCSTSACIAAYFLLVNLVPYFSSRKALFNVMGSLLVLNIFNIDWFYQGVEEYSYIATRSMIMKILSFVAMLLFVKNPDDYLIYAAILCAATAGNYVLNVLHVHRYVKGRVSDLHYRQHLKPVFILLASTIATEIYTMLDTVMLEYFYGDEYVGYYTNAVKIVRMVYTVVIAFVATYYPRISYCIKQENKDESNGYLTQGTKLILLLAIPCILGLLLVADDIVLVLFGQSFLPAVGTLRILSILVIILSLAYFLGHIILMSVGKEQYILRATICGAIANAFMNYLLIPRLAQNGAAIASVAAEVIVTTMLIMVSRQFFRLNIRGKYVLSLVISAGVMAAAVTAFRHFVVQQSVLRLILCVVVGALSYGIALVATRNELILALMRKISNRLKRRQ